MKKTLIFIILFISFFISIYADSFDKSETPITLSISITTDPTGFIFNVIHKDLITNFNYITKKYKSYGFEGNLERGRILKETDEIKKNKLYNRFIIDLNKKIDLLEKGKYPRANESKINVYKKEIILLRIDLKKDLNKDKIFLCDWIISEMKVGKNKTPYLEFCEIINNIGFINKDEYLSIKYIARLFSRSIFYKMNPCNSDLFFYLGVIYFHLKEYENACSALDKFIHYTIDLEINSVNDLLFYLDAYYYRIKSGVEIIKDNISEEEIEIIKRYIKECDSILYSDLEQYFKDSKSYNVERKEIKKVINEIWSNKENYLKLKKEVEKLK